MSEELAIGIAREWLYKCALCDRDAELLVLKTRLCVIHAFRVYHQIDRVIGGL